MRELCVIFANRNTRFYCDHNSRDNRTQKDYFVRLPSHSSSREWQLYVNNSVIRSRILSMRLSGEVTHETLLLFIQLYVNNSAPWDFCEIEWRKLATRETLLLFARRGDDSRHFFLCCIALESRSRQELIPIICWKAYFIRFYAYFIPSKLPESILGHCIRRNIHF